MEMEIALSETEWNLCFICQVRSFISVHQRDIRKFVSDILEFLHVQITYENNLCERG